MASMARIFAAGIVLAAVSLAPVEAQQVDPKIVSFKLPDQIV